MKAWHPGFRSVWLRLWRLMLLAMVVWLIRGESVKRAGLDSAIAVSVERVHDFFPESKQLGEFNGTNGWRAVMDDRGQLLGYITTTYPEASSRVGYSGPTHCLMAFDTRGTLLGIRILKSHDTVDHVAGVVADRKFFAQFRGLKPGGAAPHPLHTVTGATLTSTAIAEGVLLKLGHASNVSLRFPEPITLEEVKLLEPQAVSLMAEDAKGKSGRVQVLDGDGKKIGIAVTTSPVSDTIIGYKGPTDVLMLLNADGKALRRIAVRKSYDTKRYVAYVTGDSYFLNLFNDMALQKLAALDFKEAKIEGVSGATETSWAVAESLKQRSSALLKVVDNQWWKQVNWRWQDTGHVAVIVFALVMAFTHLRGIAWVRHVHHGVLVIYGGFIAGEMLSQSLFAGWAAHGTPWRNAPGLLLLGGVALLGPVFSSRQLYCHHICPHGALQQLLARRLPWQVSIPPQVHRWLGILPFALLALVVFIVTRAWEVDLNALEPFDAYLIRIAGAGTIVVAVVGIVAALFTPLAYCKYGCPTGALFRLVRFTGDNDRLGLRDWLAVLILIVAAFL